ncbi:MAG: LEA type 2 family protein [Gammaproteobacteria bacterium]
MQPESKAAPDARPSRIIALCLAVMLLNGCALLQDDLQPPRINLVSIFPESGSMTDLRFRCRLRLDNPNDVDLPIKGGQLELTLADRAAATGQLSDGVTVPARGSEEVEAVVSIGVMSAVSIITSIMSDPNAMLRYEVDGYVDVGMSVLGRIRFDDAGEFSLNGAGDLGSTRL